jgi:hypothetical protein
MSRASCTALAALATALLLAAPSAGEAAAVPPELAALEQQTSKLQVNSERFTLQEEVSVGELGGSSIPFTLLIAGRGEASDTPSESSVEAGLFGSTSVRERVIGETEWVYEQHAKEVDGGRPWVRRKRKPPKAANGLGLGLLETPEPGSQGTFSKLIEELNGAQTLVDSGPVTVEDERVIEFDASINPAPLIAQLEAEARAKEPRHPLESLFPELPSGGSKGPTRTFPAPTYELEVFIAPNGLPVRLRATFTYQGDVISARVDTLAINIPLSVSPPPARQTIGASKLKVLERRAAATARKRLLRVCKRLKGKSARRCRAAAKGAAEASSPPSLL